MLKLSLIIDDIVRVMAKEIIPRWQTKLLGKLNYFQKLNSMNLKIDALMKSKHVYTNEVKDHVYSQEFLKCLYNDLPEMAVDLYGQNAGDR